MSRHLVHLFLIAGVMATPLPAHAQAPRRFEGSAVLAAPQARSDDGRFQLNAGLRQTSKAGGGRFALDARLAPQASSVNTLCTPAGVTIFNNGFE
jgi:hypothetical protein